MQKSIEKYGIGVVVASVAIVGLLFVAQSAFDNPNDSINAESSPVPVHGLGLLDQRASSSTNSDLDPSSTQEPLASDLQRLDTEGKTDEESSDVSGHNQNRVYILRKVNPAYPTRALQRGIEGYVVLEFTVSESGLAIDPEIVDSEPAGIFDRAAIEALSKFEYKPRFVDGVAVRTEGVRHRIEFEIEASATLHSESPQDYRPDRSVSATYPERALRRGIEGHVVLEFTVNEDGSVVDPVVVESEPSGIFDRAAIEALSKFEYTPTFVDGVAIRTEGVRHRVDFEIEDSAPRASEETGDYFPVHSVSATYPERALQRGIEGHVVLEFTVNEKGSVVNPVVVESEPAVIFDRAAIEALSKFEYDPKIVDGKAVRTDGVRHRIEFALENTAKKIL